MFEQILVGCDSGPGTQDALRLATELALLSPTTQVTLVHAYVPRAGRFGRRGKQEELNDALHGEGMRLLESLAESFPPELRDRVDLLSLPVSSPAFALHDLAEGRDADLIVIGPAQHGPVGRLVLGSESTAILHGSPVPVAIPARSNGHAHEADATRAIGPLGVAYDGSNAASGAVELAGRLAIAQDRPLELIGVGDIAVPVVTDGFGGPSPVPAIVPDPKEVETEVRELLDERAAQLPDGVRSESVVLLGDAVHELSERSAELHLLVIGSRDYGPVQHILLGSVSRGVLDRAHCPVIVVPRP